ncbi:alpha/beta fold hydrolase [Alicyclobacillus acidoterrestris]|uniref:Alpha/beta hydrolase n=1 Tax=Alicyclobacillus acidoterrestris (strain ATCC 49025 / DSM 3922 / CIP 106132 / NCIMB 13137 / GD3B) TaxID=1356854 RepID=A0A9E7CT62_ALIAG|nr:alpha/beta hydrolase [Alicyclobacillus acidoterrestris]UNO50860.1 alpha/beta hydrolase [Alicyclobacillus acidoterrestris]
MEKTTYQIGNRTLTGCCWMPEPHQSPVGVVVILHGMSEHILRYQTFAEQLAKAGYLVHGYNQRGHGSVDDESRGDLGENGFEQLIDDAHVVIKTVRQSTDRPVVLFAHSMGSFVAQGLLSQYPKSVDACILCGSNGPEGPILHLAKWLARRYARIHGRTATSVVLTWLIFGAYNRAFRPNRTNFDWLTRDEREVDLYLSDRDCGFSLTTASMYDMFRTLQQIHRPDRIRQIPLNLPIFIIAGEKDPVGHFGRGIKRLVQLYTKHGLEHVSYKLYPDARHELLHEQNREEVMRDILSWLAEHVPRLSNITQ